MKPEGNGYTILVGEDEPEVRGYLEMSLKCLGYSVEFAQDGDEVISSLQALRSSVDVVLLDVIMPNRDGHDTLREIHAIEPGIPVIIVTGGDYSPGTVVHAMKCGAVDFLCKPVSHEELKTAIEKAIVSRVSNAAVETEPAPEKTTGFVGTAPRMREIHAFVKRVGWCEAPVLVQGETGSGKEVLARELQRHCRHVRTSRLSERTARRFPLNYWKASCSAATREAHSPGPSKKRRACSRWPTAAPMLLDEIGDMEIRLQAKFCRFCRTRNFSESAERNHSRGCPNHRRHPSGPG